MGWRFRQSFTVIPGLRLNLSSRGLSASIGASPFTVNVGPNGLRGTASIPGTGLSYQQTYHPNGAHHTPDLLEVPRHPAPRSQQHHNVHFVNMAPVTEIHSASTELLTSDSLQDLKKLIQTAFREREEISSELSSSRTEKEEASRRFDSWNDGFLLKRMFKKAFDKRKERFETEEAKVSELQEQLRLSTIETYIELESEQADLFYRLKDEFARLTECKSVWDVKTRQATDQFHERTTAGQHVGRDRVTLGLGRCDLFHWEQDVPLFRNSKGGGFFLYPGFILYRAARQAFSILEYHDVIGTASMTSFHESEGVPSDSKVIGQTWAKCNKDGSRDRRFAGNYQIPVVQYGQISFRSGSGLWEEFFCSQPDRALAFANALRRFTGSFAAIR